MYMIFLKTLYNLILSSVPNNRGFLTHETACIVSFTVCLSMLGNIAIKVRFLDAALRLVCSGTVSGKVEYYVFSHKMLKND